MTAKNPLVHRQRKAHQHREARSQLTSALLREALRAGEDQRRELHTQVIELHLNVAESIASRYRGRGQDHEASSRSPDLASWKPSIFAGPTFYWTSVWCGSSGQCRRWEAAKS